MHILKHIYYTKYAYYPTIVHHPLSYNYAKSVYYSKAIIYPNYTYTGTTGTLSTNFIGDGDSKSYLEIVANDPYSGVTVQKLECVGHFQKRVGARLRKLKSENKGKLSDGKPLTGKGRLTEKVINKLQNYFGIAIRQSTGTTVFELKKAIGAVLYHCTDFTEDETRHQFVRLSLTHGVNTKLIK